MPPFLPSTEGVVLLELVLDLSLLSSLPQAATTNVNASRLQMSSNLSGFRVMGGSFPCGAGPRGANAGTGAPPSLPGRARVEGVLKPIPEQVEGQDGDQQRQAGER